MVATKAIDFRKGHDSLAAMVKNELHKDPFTGTVYVFRAKKADRLKLLYWDGTGLVMAYKRLEQRKRSPRPIDIFSLGRLTLFGAVRLRARQGVPGELISVGVATA